MNKTTEARMNALNANGVDTSKIFNIFVDTKIPNGSSTVQVKFGKDKPSIPMTLVSPVCNVDDDDIADRIISDGYINNTALHRRWVMAQYMRMLESPNGWYDSLRKNYSYDYVFKMMLDELKVLSNLEAASEQGKDNGTFEERSKFFSKNNIWHIIYEHKELIVKDAQRQLKDFFYTPWGRLHFGRQYLTTSQVTRCLDKIDYLNGEVNCATSYHKLYELIREYINCSYYITSCNNEEKPATWCEVFQKEGAYYTLKNMLMFHNVNLHTNEGVFGMEDGLEFIKNKLDTYKAYQYHAVLKKTIEKENFNWIKSIRDHKNM